MTWISLTRRTMPIRHHRRADRIEVSPRCGNSRRRRRRGLFGTSFNGMDWFISVAPDPRIPQMNAALAKVKGADFEVVVAPR